MARMRIDYADSFDDEFTRASCYAADGERDAAMLTHAAPMSVRLLRARYAEPSHC